MAKKQRKVADAGEILAGITKWLGDSGLAWERQGFVEIDFDVGAAREEWEEEMGDEEEQATQGEEESTRHQ
tara:strand:- start:306 stop:518 length:213 start_codon:yes stop_codon:yes gene_type:complete